MVPRSSLIPAAALLLVCCALTRAATEPAPPAADRDLYSELDAILAGAFYHVMSRGVARMTPIREYGRRIGAKRLVRIGYNMVSLQGYRLSGIKTLGHGYG